MLASASMLEKVIVTMAVFNRQVLSLTRTWCGGGWVRVVREVAEFAVLVFLMVCVAGVRSWAGGVALSVEEPLQILV